MADAPPPDLPGYDFQRELGHGGFADVYLYRQRLPSREVAVKVLRQTAASAEARTQFENEANRMAMLSSHPGIVTIYEVGVSPDDRPYLTMEYCPHGHFGVIARAHPLTVARALEVGIKVAAAVETAHQASILHRDVKPANVLLTTYGEPALTDFGIAGGADGEGLAATPGVSIPFAAPEVLSGATAGDELSDVYSLAATVYALLAGRAPFSTGESMSELELIERVLNAPLPPTGRADVPASLERALARALARQPDRRPESAVAFGRALQGVEAELGLAQTPLRIADTSAVPPPQQADDEDSTRFRSVLRVDPEGPRPPAAITEVPSTERSAPPPPPTAPAAPWERAAAPEADTGLGDRTVHRQATSSSGAEPPAAEVPTPAPSTPSRRGRLVASLVGAVVLVAAVVLVISKAGDDPADPPTTSTTDTTSSLVVVGAPPRPVDVVVEPAAAGQEVRWEVPSQAEGDSYLVFVTRGPNELEGTSEATGELSLVLDTEERICVTVETVREGRVSPASTEVCSP